MPLVENEGEGDEVVSKLRLNARGEPNGSERNIRLGFGDMLGGRAESLSELVRSDATV